MWPSWDWMQDASAHSNPREVMLQDPPAVVLGGSLSGREGIGAAQVVEGRSEAQMLFNCGFPLSLVWAPRNTRRDSRRERRPLFPLEMTPDSRVSPTPLGLTSQLA